MAKAVAVDLGATSGRYAVGVLSDGRINYEVIEQIAHSPVEKNGRLEWQFDFLLDLCRRAADYARTTGATTLAIDTWGVDVGFLDDDGNLIDRPVCYRDESHLRAFESMEKHRERLFAATGCQHQPFNTIYQLIARREEDPTIVERAADWMLLPDLLGYFLSGDRFHELTEASTTQLLGIDGQWSSEAFALAGWPVPSRQPAKPGTLGSQISGGPRLAHVGSHDTASAVCGFGSLGPDDLFLNIGTWTLVGCVIDQPIAKPDASRMNCTNERSVDGRIRFLRNVPGFYVINRVHEELGIEITVPEWLATAAVADDDEKPFMVDLMNAIFFNPNSMVDTIQSMIPWKPNSDAEWARLVFTSVVNAIARQPEEIGGLVGRKFSRIRVGGGGSQSEQLCQAIASETGLTVVAGPAEVTVLGNLAVQFVAQGELSWLDIGTVLDASVETRTYEDPRL